ncbi:MAG: ATP-binding protein, partial [Planctomycetota bacterium]|nr:ATP-binding protein [Planctomycetota bacterium]
LALAKTKLEGLAARKSSAQISQAILEIRGLVDQSVHDTRSLLFDLSPVALYELGFEPAVESLLDRIQAAHRLATRFRTDGLPKPMTNDVRVVLFRGVREVVQNVVKHAQARSVGVSVGREDETVLVEVQDDGVGFDAEKALSVHDEAGGFGLFDVRERLDYLGGSLTIQSEPGKGTTATLRAPLVQEKACPEGMSHGDSSASG